MRLKRILFVILMISMLLLLPLLSPSSTIQLFPFRTQQVVINVKTPVLHLSTDITTGIDLKIYYMDPVQDKIVSMRNVTIFENDVDLEFDSRGNYIFEFFSITLGEVEIDPVGVPLFSIFLITIIALVNFSYRYYLRYTNAIQY